GKHTNEYNLKWLRQYIGVVSQEPVLIHTTIRKNILFGHNSATDEEVYEAAKIANAHHVIMTLSDKCETQVDERGAALSGGQKQRIVTCSILLFGQAASIVFGATLVNHVVITFENYLMMFNCVAVTARSAVRTITLSPDYAKGIEATENIFDLLDRKPHINNGSNDDEQISSITNILSLFTSRWKDDSNIFVHLGTSGCGKSAIIQLIERCYDLHFGCLFLATSALDSKKIVQEALDRAQQNRTSITIAHRLSTIQNTDMICILHKGRVTCT
ncbi:unnamed protein product, partial [Rotaria sp. Silwood1]